MAEVLVQFDESVVGSDGTPYTAQVCGREGEDGRWEGWIEFIPRDGGEPRRTPRETTQPNRDDLAYWASGLTRVYLDGALTRALNPPAIRSREIEVSPVFSGPADTPLINRGAVTSPRTVLDPFVVYEQGESVLRKELSALSVDHLEDIISAYALSPRRRGARVAEGEEGEAVLVHTIVDAVKERRATR